MQLKCPACGSEILSDDININSSVAKCHRCNEVFEFGNKLSSSQTSSSDYDKSNVEMPKSFSVNQSGRELIITRRWLSLKIFGLLFFCIFWDAFLVVWYHLAFTKGAPLIFKLFPLIHVGVGVFLTYTVIAGFFNKTFIKVMHPNISVEHFPIPWPGNKIMRIGEIEQLFCEEKVSSSKNGTTYTYNVGITFKGGKRDKLVSGLESPEQARFIEQEVEKFLGIKDRSVAGEMRPV